MIPTILQGCGSGSGLDPDSIGSVDPDPDSESGFGIRIRIQIQEGKNDYNLDILYGGLGIGKLQFLIKQKKKILL